MNKQQVPTVGGWMRGFLFPYLLGFTVLWVIILRNIDLLPKVGEVIPRSGVWRPATVADRIESFLWLTGGWYAGALLAFGLVWRVSEVVCDVAFDD